MLARVLVVLLAVVPSAQAQVVLDGNLLVTPYACCPQFPTSFAFLPQASPGAPIEVLILEKFSGRVRHFVNGVLQGTALDLPVSNYGERGLLGITLHPDFDTNAWIYLYYTRSPTDQDTPFPEIVLDNRVERYTWNGTALGSPQLILILPARPTFNHNGGVITFGPDGMLYGIIGDLGRFPLGQVQNIATGPPPDTTAVVYRVHDDGTPPADNPFYAMGGPMQFAYGYAIRNSFGIEFDPVTDVLWETENGASGYDEINRFPPAFNNGFIRILGPASRDPQGTSDLWMAPGAQYVDPQFSWFASVAPTAIHFLRSDSLGADYRNDIFVGAHITGSIYHFELTQDRTALVMPDSTLADLVADTQAERDLFLWASGFGSVVDLATGPDGALYALSFENDTLYRISRDPTTSVGPFPRARLSVVASPNPFRDVTRLHVLGRNVETSAEASLRIYDVAGRLVRVLDGTSGSAEWNGTDARGKRLAPGVYFVQLSAEDTAGKRIVFLQR